MLNLDVLAGMCPCKLKYDYSNQHGHADRMFIHLLVLLIVRLPYLLVVDWRKHHATIGRPNVACLMEIHAHMQAWCSRREAAWPCRSIVCCSWLLGRCIRIFNRWACQLMLTRVRTVVASGHEWIRRVVAACRSLPRRKQGLHVACGAAAVRVARRPLSRSERSHGSRSA